VEVELVQLVEVEVIRRDGDRGEQVDADGAAFHLEAAGTKMAA